MKNFTKMLFMDTARIFFLTVGSAWLFAMTAQAALEVPGIFSNKCVLQADEPVAIWGKARPGAEVVVALDSKPAARAVADGEGKWLVRIPPQVASFQEHTLNIRSGGEQIAIHEVLFGDVWLGVGQSSMVFAMDKIEDAETEMARMSELKGIRLFYAKPRALAAPADNTEGLWESLHKGSAGRFSAVMLYFAEALREKVPDRPLGLMLCALGGTSIYCWLPEKPLQAHPQSEQLLQDYNLLLEKINRQQGERSTVRFKQPSQLYNGLIAPLSALTMRGVVWYQGESDAAGRQTDAYKDLLVALIDSWRAQFAPGNRAGGPPFLIVEIPPILRWPEVAKIQEAQRQASEEVTNVFLVPTADLAGGEDINPSDKQPFGKRLAEAALSNIYAKPVLQTH